MFPKLKDESQPGDKSASRLNDARRILAALQTSSTRTISASTSVKVFDDIKKLKTEALRSKSVDNLFQAAGQAVSDNPTWAALVDELDSCSKNLKKKMPEIQKQAQSRIEYQAGIRRAMDRETMRAEHDRIRGVLMRGGIGPPQIMRDRYDELSRHLGV